jgi:AcrR family transcriptional regulator
MVSPDPSTAASLPSSGVEGEASEAEGAVRGRSVFTRRGTRRPHTDLVVVPRLRRPAAELGPRAQRTVDLILNTTKEILLARGYAGTTIDEVTRTAGISRASFYTYFPSKRDVLLALGQHAHRDAKAVIGRLAKIGDDGTLHDLKGWVAEYFAMQDVHGSFALAFVQAAQEDEELLRAGRPNLLNLSRKLGLIMDALRGHSLGDPTQHGLVVLSMLDRMWWLWRVGYAPFDEDTLLDNTTLALAALFEAPERHV